MTENIKEAIKYGVELSEGQSVIYKEEDRIFYDSNKASLRELFPAKYAETLTVNSLTGLVQYLLSKFDQETTDDPDELLIHVESPTSVKVYGRLNELDRKRESLIKATAILDKFNYGYFMNTEEFIINLQSLFDRTDDSEAILKFASAVRIDNGATINDNGVFQTATVKTGASTVGEGKVPSPANLQPYRTFLEVPQPESQFIFRINERGNCALFEADGGLWKYHAMESIKSFLEDALKELIEENKLTVIA